MNRVTHQCGVGLVEVLVAVLLLSVAVLGFSALQMRAVGATDESLVRTKSVTVVRNLAEVMRAYPEAYVTGSTSFTKALSTDTNAKPTIQAVINSSATDTVTIDDKSIGSASCLSTETEIVDTKKTPKNPCTINQLAARDALMVKKLALDEDVKVAIFTCPGTTEQAIQRQMCVITAWNDTKPLMTDDNTGDNAQACATANGVYKTGSDCLISEAY